MKTATCCIKSPFTSLNDPLDDNLEREEDALNTPLNLSMPSFRKDQGKWLTENLKLVAI
jgi:hypothetical protein